MKVENSLPALDLRAKFPGANGQTTTTPIETSSADLIRSISISAESPALANLVNFLLSKEGKIDGTMDAGQLGFADSTKAKTFYDGFWNSKRSAREEFFEDLIAKYGSKKKFFDTNKQLIDNLLGKFLPNDPKIQEAGKRYALFFIEHVHSNALAASLVSGLLQAIHNDSTKQTIKSQDTHIRFGHKLCDFLIEIGGTKLAQALHSFSNTKAEWKVGLEKSKYDSDPLTEQEFRDLAKEVINPDLYNNIQIGDYKGSGTYLDTREVTIDPDYLKSKPAYYPTNKTPAGQKFVLQLVKPHTIKRSRDIFNLMVSLIENAIGAGSKDVAKTIPIRALLPIMEHYREMLPEETDLRFAAEKAKIAEKLYNGVKVISKNLGNAEINVEFYAAGIYEYNQGSRVSRLVEGEHFEDFAKRLGPENPVVCEVAKSIDLIEKYFILSGKPFDHDRHGHNQGLVIKQTKVEGKTIYTISIGNFDENGIRTTAPSNEEKKLFANIIMDSIGNSLMNGMDFRSSIRRIFSILQEKKLEDLTKAQYANINAFIKALMSLTDYSKYIEMGNSKTAQLKTIKAIVDTGDIDPIMQKVIQERYKAISFLTNLARPKNETDKSLLEIEQKRHEDFYPKIKKEESTWQNAKDAAKGLWMKQVLKIASSQLKSGSTNYSLVKPRSYDERFMAAN